MKKLQITAYRITPNCREYHKDETGKVAFLSIMDDMIEKIQRTLMVDENKKKTIKITLTLLTN